MTKEEIIKKNKEIKKSLYILKGGYIVAEKKKVADSFDELKSQFEEVNNKYDINTNSKEKYNNDLNLTKIDNIELNNDDISKIAKDSLQEYYTNNVNSINSKNKNAIENLNNSIETQKENATALKDNVDKTIDNVKNKANNDALKRGLARSSIIINKLNAFDNAKIEEYNRIDRELTNSVNKINQEIGELNKQKDDALSDFDIAYASKLNDKINTLTKELQEKQTEITKYNNEIAQIEAKYEDSKLKNNNDLEQKEFDNYLKVSNFIAKYGLNSLNAVKNNEKYEYTYDYLKTMTKDKASEFLKANEKILTSEMGSSYYHQLVKAFNV